MKRTKLLLLMALLVIPFLGARADSTTDLVNGTLTYTVSQDGGGHFAWYATTSHSSNEWGGKENCEQATSLVLKCTGNGVLNNTDIIALRKVLAANANLISVSLYDAKFTTDLKSDNGTGYWNVYGDDKHEWSGITKGVTSTSNYGSYTNSWDSTIYGYCIADELGAGMFADCTHLQIVVLPASISKIGTGSFCGCTNLKIVYVPSNITAFGWESFMGDNSLTALVPYGNDNTDLSKVTIVDAEAFKDCSLLPTSDFQSLTGVTTIGYRAFQNTQVDLTTVQQIIKQFQHGNTSSSDGGYEKIPYQAFSGCTKIVGEVDLTANTGGYIKGIDAQAFENCTGMTGVKINSEVTSLGNEAFSGCTSLATVEVNSATAPTCGTDVFKGVVPNACEVVFATTGADAYDATGATGYMTYRVHQNDNDFKYLLTKTMDEDNTDYTVVPQRHADVVLHRTFKAGWNTLALPFGSAYDANKTTDCAEIYQNALKGKGTTGTSDFMIAGYRGFNTVTKTFYFLKNEDVANIPLNEFEPLLIKMGEGDIASSENKYTFENVEVNYDGSSRYEASTVKQLIGKMSGSTQYDNTLGVHYDNGNYDSGLNKKLTNLDYGTYFFTGTLYTQKRTAEASASIENFIQAGDYIIQDNNFYKVAAGSNYGLKGFRGWFKQLNPSASGAKSSTLSIDVVNNGGETTDIVKIDANGEEVKDMNNVKVYNINGQLVGTSLDGLSKGLYIVNGKKCVVK